MNLKKRAFVGVKWTLINQVARQVIGFVISVMLARLLLPEEFGLIAMIAVFVSLGRILMTSGLGNSLIRTKNANDEDYSVVFFFNLGTSILFYIIIYLTAPYIAAFYDKPVLIPIVRTQSLVLIINSFAMVQGAMLTKKMDFKTQTFINLPTLFLSGSLGIFLAYKGFGVWSLVYRNIFGGFISVLLTWYFVRWIPLLKFNLDKFKYHFRFGYKLALSAVIDSVFNNIYPIIIGKYFNAAEVGLFQRAKSLPMYPVNIISSVIGRVSYPLFSEIQDENVQLKNAYSKILKLNAYILSITLIIAGILAEPLFRFLFTEKWLPAVPYFRILLLPAFLYPLHAINLNMLMVKGRSDLFLKLEVIKKVNVTISLLLAIPFGIYGLLWGSVLTSIVAFWINTHYTGKYIGYSPKEQLKDIFPIILIAFFSGLVVFFLDRLEIKMQAGDFIRIVTGSFLGLILFVSLVEIFKIESYKELKTFILKR